MSKRKNKCDNNETFKALCLYCDKITPHIFTTFEPYKPREIRCTICGETQEYVTAIMRGR